MAEAGLRRDRDRNAFAVCCGFPCQQLASPGLVAWCDLLAPARADPNHVTQGPVQGASVFGTSPAGGCGPRLRSFPGPPPDTTAVGSRDLAVLAHLHHFLAGNDVEQSRSGS